MTAFYSEWDPYAAAWLRNLIDAGHIAPGVVDERSIEALEPDELGRFTQCHFFAGIGVWSYALRLAAWPDARPVWTGSCPCQPFSVAGKGEGHADERHLWPAWQRLIRECSPAVVFGEQVAGGDGLAWLDAVFTDLEDDSYAVAAANLCAAGVGAPHIRQRLFFVAHASGFRYVGGERSSANAGASHNLAEAIRDERLRNESVADGDGDGSGFVGHTERNGLRIRRRPATDGVDKSGFWSVCDWLACRDGKWRAVEPGIEPLAHGATARVGRLRAYGNAIVPQVAAEFIRAVM